MGLVIALLYAAWLYAARHLSGEIVFIRSTHFLYVWYFIWSIVLAVIVGSIALGITAGATASGKSNVQKFGMFLVSGTLSIFALAFFLVRRAMYVVGTYMLSTAVSRT